MSEHPIPPPGSPQDLAARALTRLVQQKAEQTAEAATMAIGAGVGNYSMIAARPSPESPFAAIVLVVSGKMADSDMRRFMEFAQAFEQDVSVGTMGRNVDRWEVNLNPRRVTHHERPDESPAGWHNPAPRAGPALSGDE